MTRFNIKCFRVLGFAFALSWMASPNSECFARPKGDTLEAGGGIGSLSIYGKSIESLTKANNYFYGRFIKDIGSGWGGMAEYAGSLGSGFDGFTIGVSYDLTPFIFGDSYSDVIVQDGTIVTRYSVWRLRGLVGAGMWTFSGVVNTSGDTRIPKRAISASIYGPSLNLLLEHMIHKDIAIQVQTQWITGFASDFGGQQVALALGLGWVGL